MHFVRVVGCLLSIFLSTSSFAQVSFFGAPVIAEGSNSVYGLWRYLTMPATSTSGSGTLILPYVPPNGVITNAIKRYTIIRLPTLGGPGGTALNINNNSYVTGSSDNVQWTRHAYLFNVQQMDGLKDLDPARPNSTSEAWGLNDLNDAAGLFYDVATGRFRATLFPSGGAPVDLGAPVGVDSFAHAIDNLGRVGGVIGGQGVVWDAQQVMTTLPSPAPHSSIWDMNDNGQVVGASALSSSSTYPEHAAIWQIDSYTGSISGPEYIPAPVESRVSECRAISNNGTAVGSVDMNTYGEGFVSVAPNGTEGRTMTLIGLLPNGRFSQALGVNDRNEVVGVASTNSFPIGYAVYWSQSEGLVNLNNRVVFSGDNDWILVAANAINNRGEIVGYGIYKGGYQAFLLKPLGEPSTSLAKDKK